MVSVIYRPDYAKFIFHVENDLFHTFYNQFCEKSHECKFHGDFLKNHHVSVFPGKDVQTGRYILEVWGEWAGIVNYLPVRWMLYLTRFDIRGVLWDTSQEQIQSVGQALQLGDCPYNVETFNSKPASKRFGRDRGGVGFRVGSRKSDICLVVYQRGQEKPAMEFRFQGPTLRKMYNPVVAQEKAYQGTVSGWKTLMGACEAAGNARLMGALERVGIGSYWPVELDRRGHHTASESRFQTTFLPSEADLAEFQQWAESIDRTELPGAFGEPS